MNVARENIEFVIGLVAPVGVDLAYVQNRLTGYLKQFKYKSNHIRLSYLIERIKDLETPIDKSTEYKRIDSLMTAGDEAREKAGRGLGDACWKEKLGSWVVGSFV